MWRTGDTFRVFDREWRVVWVEGPNATSLRKVWKCLFRKEFVLAPEALRVQADATFWLVNGKVAICLNGGYAIAVENVKLKHVQEDCKCRRVGCMFCDGGLFSCTVCGSFEGATTTDCPGYQMTEEERDRVYAGTLDFRGCVWVKAPSGSCSSHYDGRPGLPDEVKQ